MSIQIFDSVLQLAVDGLLELIHDFVSSRLSSLKVRFYTLDKHFQALRSMAELRRRSKIRSDSFQHDPGIAKMHLCTADCSCSVTIVIVLFESEYSGEPRGCFCNIAIGDVRQHSIGRDGTVVQHTTNLHQSRCRKGI